MSFAKLRHRGLHRKCERPCSLVASLSLGQLLMTTICLERLIRIQEHDATRARQRGLPVHLAKNGIVEKLTSRQRWPCGSGFAASLRACRLPDWFSSNACLSMCFNFLRSPRRQRCTANISSLDRYRRLEDNLPTHSHCKLLFRSAPSLRVSLHLMDPLRLELRPTLRFQAAPWLLHSK